jgi:hypothetical protein
MTRDELIAISSREIERLPAEERELLQNHFGTDDNLLLPRLLAEEAEEMWSPPGDAPVDPPEWPRAHLELLLGLHRDQQREDLMREQRRIALEVLDAMAPARRALLCWRFHTTRRPRLVVLAASATVRAIEEGLIHEPSFKEAVIRTVEFEIEIQIDDIDEEYHRDSTEGGTAMEGSSGPERTPHPPAMSEGKATVEAPEPDATSAALDAFGDRR